MQMANKQATKLRNQRMRKALEFPIDNYDRAEL
jgi:hypothetical protein